MFSRNTSSSRAIPFKKMVESIKQNPFVTIGWQKDHKGMQGSEYFTGLDVKMLQEKWLRGRDRAIETALERDSLRYRQVGEAIIRKQAKRFLHLKKTLSLDPVDFTPKIFKNDITKPKCIILDIDGTISEPCERDIYDGSKAINDVLQPHVYHAIKDAENLIICTGRSDEYDEVTKAWLRKHNIDYVKFYSRSKYDYRADWIVKERMWEDIAKDYYIDMMYEDRNSVVRRARSLGLKVAQVKYGNY